MIVNEKMNFFSDNRDSFCPRVKIECNQALTKRLPWLFLQGGDNFGSARSLSFQTDAESPGRNRAPQAPTTCFMIQQTVPKVQPEIIFFQSSLQNPPPVAGADLLREYPGAFENAFGLARGDLDRVARPSPFVWNISEYQLQNEA